MSSSDGGGPIAGAGLWNYVLGLVNAVGPKVEQLKAETGHGGCVGWWMTDGTLLRCGCGAPLMTDLAAPGAEG